MYSRMSDIKVSTSSFGLRQFSVEKAYKVRCPIPSSLEFRTISRTESMPIR